MPWNKVNLDEQRMRFVIRAVSGKERMTSLVPGVWDFATDGVPVAEAVRGERQFHRRSASESASAAQSRRTEAETEERVAALRQADRLGSEEVARAAARRTAGAAAGANDSPHFGASWAAERSGAWGGAAALRALGGERTVADGQQGKYPVQEGECHPLSILDDHSRYVVGLYALPELSGDPGLAVSGRRRSGATECRRPC